MNEHEDDFSSEDPIVRALRAPGTAEELGREQDFLAAFAAQRPRGSVRRLFGRVGVGATTAVAAVALSTGVAAAYTGGLPDPVQEFAHDVLGPVGVPAPGPARPTVATRTPEKTPGPTPTPTSGPTATPTATGTKQPRPSATPTRGTVVAPTPTSAAGVPTPTPTTGATTPSTPRVPASVSVSVSDTRVLVDRTVTVSGVVTAADGHLLRHRTVRLMSRVGKQKWTQVGSARTDKSGQVSLTSPALTRNTQLRLATGNRVRSSTVRVVVVPVLSATSTQQDGSTTVTVAVRGARAGDTVALLGRKGGKYVRLAEARLTAEGSATMTVPTPKRMVRLVIRVLSTPQHASGQTSRQVGPAARPTG